MTTQDASSAAAPDTTPVVIEQPPIAVATQPATLASQPQGEFNPDIFVPVDTNPDVFVPVDTAPAESPAEALARLVNSNLQASPPLTDYLTADQLREVFLPIIDFMRAAESTTHVPVVYAQPGLPTAAQGLDGDLWVSEASADLYIKQQGRWRTSARLRGLDGATPVKGVDYVDAASLDSYAGNLKASAVQAATAQVSQTVQTILANVKTTDGRGLVYNDPVVTLPVIDTMEPLLPDGTVPAPGPQPVPEGAYFAPLNSFTLPLTSSYAQAYDTAFAFTVITRTTAGVGLTCQVSDLSGERAPITYAIPFVGNSAAVCIPVPANSDTLFRSYAGAYSPVSNAFDFTVQGYSLPIYSAQL